MLGTGALVLFGGRLLPARAPVDRPAGAEPVASVTGADITRGYAVGQTARLRVSAASPLVGASPAEVGLRQRSRYREINWESIVLSAAILPMATALEKTGAMDLVVARLEPIGAAGPLAMLVALFGVPGLMRQFISNTATAALVAPVASTAFATPVSTPVIMLVLGPGGYRFRDLLRVGLPLQLLFGILTVLVVPRLFPF